jgi:aspartate carbamoyltransferase catalytic subunit
VTRHLLGIRSLLEEDGVDGVVELLRLTQTMQEVSARPIPKVAALRGKTVVSLFFEDSTRTRLSFETAAKRLSADTMSFTVSSSSVKKGESLRDTVETIVAMGVDAIVVRHSASGAPIQVARWGGVSTINAGDGWREHPTQALLDCATLIDAWGVAPAPDAFAGRHIGIVGDIAHSRVARSNVLAFTALGATVTLVAPRTLLPPAVEGWGVRVSHDLDPELPSVDALYVLRMQRERMTEALVPSLREYAARFGVDRRRAALLREGVPVLHPGPMNRGVEIAADVADLPAAVITDQVRNGVSVRMAVLFHLLAQGAVVG